MVNLGGHNNLGTVSDWRRMQSIMEDGQPRRRSTNILEDNIELKKLNAEHGGFVTRCLARFDETDRRLDAVDKQYSSFIDSLERTGNLVGQMEENGNVIFEDNHNTQNDIYVPSASVNSANIATNLGVGTAMV